VFLLDTDHISLLQRAGAEGGRIRQRLSEISPSDVYVSIVSYEEQSRGWLAETARARSIRQQQAGYEKLRELLELYCSTPLLFLSDRAVEEFQRLWLGRLRVGTMDLKIAAIALANDATLLTRNVSDFRKVTGLRVEDWSV
jgi:Predicted nucleic acid-binding protein, contains PIN domain